MIRDTDTDGLHISSMIGKLRLQEEILGINTSVSSVFKRKHERDVRIQEIRNQEYPIKIGKFAIKYYTY